jgi:putative transcriptional regulator
MKKRNLIAEMTEGFDALVQQSAGKRTLRAQSVVLKWAPKYFARELVQLREKLNP